MFKRHSHPANVLGTLAILLFPLLLSSCVSPPEPTPTERVPPSPQVVVTYTGPRPPECASGFNATFNVRVDRTVNGERINLTLATSPKNETVPRPHQWMSLAQGNHAVSWWLRLPGDTTEVTLSPKLEVTPTRPSQVYIATVTCALESSSITASD